MAINPDLVGGPQSGVPTSRGQELYETLKNKPMRAIPLLTLGASKLLIGRPCLLCGFSLTPGGGAAGIMTLIDGDDNNGLLVGAAALAANTSVTAGPNDDGPLCTIGLFFNWASGSWSGAVWVKA